MAGGHADDLATAVLLATDAPVLVAPAMNPAMWAHPATQRNVATLRADGIRFVGPNAGEMAERGEAGARPHGRAARDRRGRRARSSQPAARPLAGRHVLVTSGPTHEPIDPVRYLANRSSGRQGHAIAAAAAAAGARVTLVAGPVAIADPPGVAVGPCRDGARDAASGRGGAARRRRGHGGGGRRLARRQRPRDGKIKKDGAARRRRCR